jgi:hypothetical protein
VPSDEEVKSFDPTFAIVVTQQNGRTCTRCVDKYTLVGTLARIVIGEGVPLDKLEITLENVGWQPDSIPQDIVMFRRSS